MIQELLGSLLDGRDLTRDEARGAMHEIMRGEATHAQIGALLGALAAKGETASEVAGGARALRTAMRAKAFPGEDPSTLPLPEAAAPLIVEMLSPGYAKNGELIEFKP